MGENLIHIRALEKLCQFGLRHSKSIFQRWPSTALLAKARLSSTVREPRMRLINTVKNGAKGPAATFNSQIGGKLRRLNI
jgi:hypothetical protein